MQRGPVAVSRSRLSMPFSIPGFKVTPFSDAEYLRYRYFQWNTNKDLHTPYNDTKRRAVSLRQPSFLFFEIV